MANRASGLSGLRAGQIAAVLLATLVSNCLLLAAFSDVAGAANEYELNDTRDTAYGPLAGGTAYTASLETENDVDWYVFYLKTYSQMDFSATMVKTNYAVVELYLYDKDGNSVGGEESGYFEAGEVNVTNHWRLTLNAGRYYLKVDRNLYTAPGDRYRFRIDPAASITTSRECGEAIVARDAIAPAIANLNQELAKNSEKLAIKAQAVKKAKKLIRRLQRRRWASRSQRLSAKRRLEGAKAARKKVWDVQLGLQTAITQQQQALAGAEGQIATYC